MKTYIVIIAMILSCAQSSYCDEILSAKDGYKLIKKEIPVTPPTDQEVKEAKDLLGPEAKFITPDKNYLYSIVRDDLKEQDVIWEVKRPLYEKTQKISGFPSFNVFDYRIDDKQVLIIYNAGQFVYFEIFNRKSKKSHEILLCKQSSSSSFKIVEKAEISKNNRGRIQIKIDMKQFSKEEIKSHPSLKSMQQSPLKFELNDEMTEVIPLKADE